MSNQEVQGKVKKPFYKKVWFWILVVIVAAVAASSGSGESDTQKKTETVEVAENNAAEKNAEETAQKEAVEETAAEENVEEQQEEAVEEVVYTAYTVSQMMRDLNGNALKAESTYNNQYVEITGRLSNIDSSGAYISIMPEDDEWAIIGVTCYIKTDEQKAQVMEMSVGDMITLKGKVTSVGEVMGYALDIDSINE